MAASTAHNETRPPRSICVGTWRQTARQRCRLPRWRAAIRAPRAWLRRFWTSEQHPAVDGASSRLAADLPLGALLKLTDETATIRCVSGVLWITCEGDTRDYLLTAGAELDVRGAGLTLVQALRPAGVEISRRELDE